MTLFGLFRRKTPAAHPLEAEPEKPSGGMVMTERFLAALDDATRPAPRLSPWRRLPKVPPGVIPKGARTGMAMDSGLSGLQGWGLTTTVQGGEGLGWLGFAYLSELAQRPEYRTASEIIAGEMTREWIEITVADDEEGKEDRLAELNKAVTDFKVRQAFRTLAMHDGQFGRAHLYPDLGWTKDADEQQTPLVISKEKIKQGQLQALRVVEPVWCYPGVYNANDPLGEDYYKPTHWYVFGRTIHRTRFMTFVSREMPDLLKPSYAFAGMSLSQMLKPYVDNWIRTRQSVSDLVHSFSVMHLATNMQGWLENPQEMLRRLAAFVKGRDNRGVFLTDKEGEEFTNVSAPLGTVDKLLAQSQEQMAAIARIPLVKYLGVTPSGLNASSDGEIKVFYDSISDMQEHVFREHLTATLNILQLHLWGEIDPAFGFKFVPLWQLDEVAQALVDKTKADTHAVYVEIGAVDAGEVRVVVGTDPDTPYPGIDVDDVPEPEQPELEEGVTENPAKGAEPRRELRNGT